MGEVGQTGARFGSPKQRRRRQSEPEDTPEEVPDIPRPAPRGARFHGMATPEPEPEPPAEPEPVAEFFADPEPEEPLWLDSEVEEPSALVRPYARTGGRTTSRYDLRLETLVSLRGGPLPPLGLEHQPIVDLCAHTRSVAEVAAALPAPLGVARVLLGDLIDLGVLTAHVNSGERPDLELLERVLTGLRGL
ncbi:hypothetical protein GCM10010174_60100 [Kutzneria viridogrisea]|uniref:DUF742 domain-containing protein n=1 Tax=Kutzneria viridogrisea TaxID=47990 RepID=A0ABR6BJS6_9PSEU|nr:hypothetical protein [Kutzneria viridogrisea]